MEVEEGERHACFLSLRQRHTQRRVLGATIETERERRQERCAGEGTVVAGDAVPSSSADAFWEVGHVSPATPGHVPCRIRAVSHFSMPPPFPAHVFFMCVCMCGDSFLLLLSKSKIKLRLAFPSSALPAMCCVMPPSSPPSEWAKPSFSFHSRAVRVCVLSTVSQRSAKHVKQEHA